MIKLYTANTPICQAATIMLEKLGSAYELNPTDLGALEQKEDDFRRSNLAMSINPRLAGCVDFRAQCTWRRYKNWRATCR